MNRIFEIQGKLFQHIALLEKQKLERDYPLDWERIHLASCAKIGLLLAGRRGVDPETAAIACAVHDFGRILTGKQENHAANAYQPLKEFLGVCGDFSQYEIETLAQAARNHSNKQEIGAPLEEIVKDADVLDCHQYGQILERQEQRDRLQQVLAELGLENHS